MTDDAAPEAQEPAEDYDLKITGPGLSIERKVSQATALELISTVMGGGGASAAEHGRRRAIGGAGRRGPGVAVAEYLNDVGATTQPQRITAFAAYLDEGGKETFSRDEIKNLYQKAGEPRPSNYPRDFGLAVTNGWLAESSEPGAYYLTATGRAAVADKFASGTKAKPARRRRNRKGAASKAAKQAANDE